VTIALLPGAGGAAVWFWQRVIPYLRSAGHHVVAVDLPAADDSAGLADYADVAVAALSGVPDPVVIVAQSMGAFTAPLVAERVVATQIILVNPMVPAPGESPGQFSESTGLSHEDFDPVEDFFHDVPADVRAAALAEPEPPQSDTPFAAPWPLAAWPDIPTRVLCGSEDRLFPVDFQRRVVRERLGLDIDVIAGGHLNALSRPAELAERLLSYL
jgi:pimeloyl-ACP methyl ester carboxylesterase